MKKRKITKEQLKNYITDLVVWQEAEIGKYINGLQDQLKQMELNNEQSSNPPGEPPPPPKH